MLEMIVDGISCQSEKPLFIRAARLLLIRILVRFMSRDCRVRHRRHFDKRLALFIDFQNRHLELLIIKRDSLSTQSTYTLLLDADLFIRALFEDGLSIC